jgi:hypothetical protein
MTDWLNFIASLALPLWGIGAGYLGMRFQALSWLTCGVGTFLVGMVLLAGNPLVARRFYRL